MDAGKKKLDSVLSRTTILQVPHFQRSYVWDEEQWSRFLEDIRGASQFDAQYFMGSIILKQQETPAGNQTNDVRTIIDGQQRITTLLLFFKALSTINETPDFFEENLTSHYGELLLEHNYLDRPIFDKILLGQLDDLNSDEKENLMYRCYQYFINSIQKDEIDPIKLYLNLYFVGIDLSSTEDEQQIFDTINSLGVRLTTAELLKNYLFKNDIKAYEKNWRDVFEKDLETKNYWEQEVTSGGKTRSNLDIFLQSYLFIKMQEEKLQVSAEDKIKFFKVESAFNSYKSFINKYGVDKDTIISELKDYASVYRDIIKPDIVKRDFEESNYINNHSADRLNIIIFGLDTAAIVPYVLFIAKNITDTEERSKIYKYLETYLMRRIICRSSTKNYSALFRNMLINNKIKTLNKLKDFIEKKSDDIINKMPSDEEVKKGIEESRLSNKQAKGVLYLIEKMIRTSKDATNLKSFDEYSLEHVMPKKWNNNWKSENLTNEQEDERNRILLTLGNLTLITKPLNSSIRDSDWRKKKEGAGDKGGLMKYAQGIKIFDEYLSREVWDEQSIKQRAKKLYDYAVNSVWNATI